MTSTPLRILHLSQRAFWCGESNRVRVVCKGLHERDWPVVLGAPPTSALASVAQDEGIPVDTRFEFRGGFRPASIRRDVRALRQCQQEGQFHIIHLHTSVDTWIAALAFGFQRGRQRPLLIRTRHSDHASRSDPIHRWLYGRAIDHVILSSDSLREPLAGLIRSGALTSERMTVIHSSVDLDRFDPSQRNGTAIRKELDLGERFCIGLIGRVSREKGHDLLIQAIPALRDVQPDVCCVFVGTGAAEADFRQRVQDQGLSDHVRFTGFRKDIAEIMAAMDVITVPSRRVESSPGVVKEGMAMSKAVIAADVGGVREIIDHGLNGWVIPRNDAGALTEALVQMIQQPTLREQLAAQARQRVADHFSDTHLVDRTLQLYQRLVPTA